MQHNTSKSKMNSCSTISNPSRMDHSAPPRSRAAGSGNLGKFDETVYVVCRKPNRDKFDKTVYLVCRKPNRDATAGFETPMSSTFMDGSEFMKNGLQDVDQACDGSATSKLLIGPDLTKELKERRRSLTDNTKEMDSAIRNGMRMARWSSCPLIDSHETCDIAHPTTLKGKSRRSLHRSKNESPTISNRSEWRRERRSPAPTVRTASLLESLRDIYELLGDDDDEGRVTRNTERLTSRLRIRAHAVGEVERPHNEEQMLLLEEYKNRRPTGRRLSEEDQLVCYLRNNICWDTRTMRALLHSKM